MDESRQAMRFHPLYLTALALVGGALSIWFFIEMGLDGVRGLIWIPLVWMLGRRDPAANAANWLLIAIYAFMLFLGALVLGLMGLFLGLTTGGLLALAFAVFVAPAAWQVMRYGTSPQRGSTRLPVRPRAEQDAREGE